MVSKKSNLEFEHCDVFLIFTLIPFCLWKWGRVFKKGMWEEKV